MKSIRNCSAHWAMKWAFNMSFEAFEVHLGNMEIVSKWDGYWVRTSCTYLGIHITITIRYLSISTTKFVKIWHFRCEMGTFHILCDDAYMLVIIYWWKESWYSIMRKQTKFSFAVPTIVPWEIRQEIWLWWHTFLLCEEDTNIIHKKGS